MNSFTIITNLLLYGLTLLCFFIPYRKGLKHTAYIVGVTLGVLITLTIISNWDFPVIFVWSIIFMFQIIFLSYWAFNKTKTGLIIATVLTIGFLLLILQPWISDWTFSKKDATKIRELTR